jgi:hypothetical protein
LPADPSGALVTGRFALDLLAIPGLAEVDETFFVYAFSRDVMAGPVLMATLGEAAVQGR